MKSLRSFSAVLTLVVVLALAATLLVACNGGDVKLSFVADGVTAPAAITAKGGSNVTLPELENKTVNGVTYIFDGWSLNSDLSGDVYRGTVSAPKSDSTYYAIWAVGYRLTLNAAFGRLDIPFVFLKAGANIADAVKGMTPTVSGDLTFEAWYLGEEQLKATTVMPSNDATLTAKYNVGFTIKHFLQDTDGEYTENETLRETSSGLVGNIASGGVPLTISGYLYNPARSERTANITLSEVAASNVVEYYYDIDGYHVTYHANQPSGTVVSGEMKEQIAEYGESLTAWECGFELAGYRFLGWADWQTSYDPGWNNIDYAPNDTLDFDGESAIDLYAIWQPGAADALGGRDYLFLEPYVANATKVYLMRDKVEEKTGDFDPATGVFTFKEDNNVILKGILNTETNFFYYYNETLYNIPYASRDDANVTVTIGQDYSATYKNGAAETQGKVTYDTEWGYYVFTSDDFDTDKLMLRFVFEEDEDGNITIAFQNMDEAGYYATAGGYPVIYLDGLGTFRYYFDPEHPTYYDITNEPVLEAWGYYQVNASGYYECSMYVGETANDNSHLEDFIFRILKGTAPGKAGNYELKEDAIERSEFYGQLADDLYLDGFGGGTYTTHADENDKTGTKHTGTYSIIHNFWLTENSADADQVWFIDFEYEGATEDVYFAIQQNRSGTVIAQYFGSVPHDEEGGLWIFDGSITLGGETYGDAFIMFLIGKNNETMVLVKIDEQELGSGEMAAIYAPMFTGTVTKTGDTFNFVSVSGDAQLSFKFKEEREGMKYAQAVTSTGEDTDSDREIADNLTVHPSTGRATYIDENGTTHDDVTYTYSGGEYLEFYTFRIDDEHRLYYYRDNKNNANKFVKTSGESLLDYAFISEDVMFAYPARLLLAEGGAAYIALPMAIGEPVYVGLGRYNTVEEGVYGVEFTDWLDDTQLIEFFGGEGFEASLRTFHEYYNSFNFRIEGGSEDETGEFYVRFDKRFNDNLGDMYFTLSNFKADGYSNEATYTLDNGYELEGTFYRMDIIIVFEVYDANDVLISSYYLKEDTANNRMKNVSDDAGLYYFYDIDDTFFETFGPDYGGSLTDYIIFDGEEDVTIVDIREDYLANTSYGKMRRTDSWTQDFREYEIDTGESVYRVLLGSFITLWHEEVLVYDLQSNAYSGDYLTDKYGTLKGNGYRLNSATYDEDGDGKVDHTGLMVRATFDKKDIQTHAYTVDENGDVIVFTYKVNEEISESIVFDAITDDNGDILYLKERELRFGSFAAWEVGKRTGEYMYLDGQGNAELYTANGDLIGNGTYQPAPEISETSYKYESEDKQQTFYFAIYIESEEGGSTYFEYRIYSDQVEGEYDAVDWSHLTMNSFGEITFTDRYGVVYQGYYEIIDSVTVKLITYDGSGVTFTFTFAYNESGVGTFRLDEKGHIEVEPSTPEGPAEPSDTTGEE